MHISRLIRKAGVTVHIKPYNTIRGKLVHPKDKVDHLDKCGTVYHIKCVDCSATYVGKTERILQMWVNEHQCPSSPVQQHIMEQHHHFKSEEVSVLHQESNWFKRDVAEGSGIKQRPGPAHTPCYIQGAPPPVI